MEDPEILQNTQVSRSNYKRDRSESGLCPKRITPPSHQRPKTGVHVTPCSEEQKAKIHCCTNPKRFCQKTEIKMIDAPLKHLLSFVIFLPLAGSLLLLFIPKTTVRIIRAFSFFI